MDSMTPIDQRSQMSIRQSVGITPHDNKGQGSYDNSSQEDGVNQAYFEKPQPSNSYRNIH